MGNKSEATWHPGDGPVKPLDLIAKAVHNIIEDGSWSDADELESLLVAKLSAALAAETARADQAKQRIADAKAHVATLVSALAKENDVRLYILAKRAEKVLSAAPTTGQEAK